MSNTPRASVLKYNGRNRIAGGDGRGATESAREPASFSAGLDQETDRETDEAYASRVLAKHNGPRQAPPAQQAASPALTPMPFVPAPPLMPTAEEEAAFLTRLARAHGGPGLAAAVVRSEAASILGQAVNMARLVARFNHFWSDSLRPFGDRLARLQAMARALERAEKGGEPIVYTPPTSEEVAEARGRLVADVARGKKVPASELVLAARARFFALHTFEAQAEKLADAHFYPSSLRSNDVDALRDQYHRTTLGLSGMAPERTRIVAFLAAFPGALGRAVTAAAEAAGGRASVEGDLAAIHLIDAVEPDPDEEELSATVAQIKALGDSPGRAAQGLIARRDELATALDARRTAAREDVSTQAEQELTSALAGDPEGVQALAVLVAARPAAFADGLGKALADAPRLAMEETGLGALANIMI